MSSLYSLARKNRRGLIPESMTVPQEVFMRLRVWLLNLAKPPDCILVNAQSVADDILQLHAAGSGGWNLTDVPAVTPPFRSMWLEFTFPGSKREKLDRLRYAVQTVREQHDNGHTLDAFIWIDYQGELFGPCCRLQCVLDATGSIDDARFRAFARANKSELQENQEGRWKFVFGCSLQSLARLNCKNTELRPIHEVKFRPHSPNKVTPASVWHEIVITSVPKIRSGGQDVSEHDEREVRAHWIRGHYADYRKGRGLFGNPKLRCLFWIPEHRRGNEELGQIIPEYTVQ